MKTKEQEECDHYYDIFYKPDYMQDQKGACIERCSKCKHERLNYKGIITPL